MRRPSNWVSAVVTLLCGAMLGLLTTVAHRASAPIAGWSAPLGLVLGTIAAVAFVIGCRLLWESRLPAVGAALGLVLAMGVVTLLPGSAAFYATDGLDPLDASWTFVPAVLAVAAVVRPSRRNARASADRIESPVHVHPGDRQ